LHAILIGKSVWIGNFWPVDGNILVVPRYAFIVFRTVIIRYAVADHGTRLECAEGMPKANRNPQLIKLFGSQDDRDPSAVGFGIGPQIDRNVEH
jgi:hypothetical protein